MGDSQLDLLSNSDRISSHDLSGFFLLFTKPRTKMNFFFDKVLIFVWIFDKRQNWRYSAQLPLMK